MAKTLILAAVIAALSLAAFAPAFTKSFAKSVALKAHDILFAHMAGSGLVLGVNAFSKEERVAFEEIVSGFEDALEISKAVAVYRRSAQEMERSDNVIWRPQPYIAQSFDGVDQTGNFKGNTQLSVPAAIGYSKSSPWEMTASELNDALQSGRLGDAAKQKLASDINVACANVACLQGSLWVKRTAAASGFDDAAECDALMTEQGIQTFDRVLALHARDYNSMASNLAGRANMQGKPATAYEKAYVGVVSGFDTFKAAYTYRLAAAAGGAITIGAANQFYTPKATSIAATGEKSNVDNRTQTITVSATANVKVGDAFKIAGVNAAHHITKQDTGQAKTFRVAEVVDGTHLKISPPIISGGGGTDAEKQYQNVTATPANGAAITWLNTAAANINPFWVKGAIELMPGRYSPEENAGMAVMRATTEQGIEILMAKQASIDTLKSKYRLDVRFGVTMLQPEMAGGMQFSQT